MEESDLDAIHGLLLYIRNKGFQPRHHFDPPPSGPYDKTARTTANLDEAITKLAHRTRTETAR
jgi:hypothetical protein